jgi:hypothetical protein
MPHIETGEFANIGIILVAPKAGFFGYRVETRRYGRVTNFFDTLEPEFFRKAVGALVHELERVRKMLPGEEDSRFRMNIGLEEPFARLFAEITRDREGIVNFSASRVALSDNPRKTLDKLFGHYVERNFVTQQYRETILEQRMKVWLQEVDIGSRFVKRNFDDGVYRASFPFVEMDDAGEAQKILKPFFLGQKDPTSIIDHGVKWATSVSRLRSAGLIPERVLFAVEGPNSDQSKAHITAFQETRELLQRNDIDVLPFEAREPILEYASS